MVWIEYAEITEEGLNERAILACLLPIPLGLVVRKLKALLWPDPATELCIPCIFGILKGEGDISDLKGATLSFSV